MKIGLYVNNENHKDVVLDNIRLGNPGIGGSEYWFYILAYYLTEYYKDVECVFFTTAKLKLIKQNISNVIALDIVDAVKKAKDDKINVFIMNKHANVGTCDLFDLCNLIDELKLPTITVGHNFYSKKECDLISKCEYIKRNVFVSKQQYSIYSDLDIYKKSSYIFGFIPMNNLEIKKTPSEMIITYAGSLTGTKGFHVLARNWKKILKQCPDAKLNVIGNGKLYSKNTKLGKFNIADQDYENSFMPYLLDENGKILDSVKLLGLISREEVYKVYSKTTVGVVNPSGLSECCPLSAIELELMGVPVVSKKYGGLLDTIKDKETGLLFKKEKGFVSSVVKLLKDKMLNDEYSRNAYQFVRETFTPEKNIPIWYNLFQEIISNKPLDSVDPKLFRKIKKIIYALQVGRPPLNKVESLSMPFNNYKKYSKPGGGGSFLNKIRKKIRPKEKLRIILNIFSGYIYGIFTGVNASEIAFEEQLIFPEEEFMMPEMKDVFGETHKNFHAYETTIPPFYVRSFKDAYCFTNREEVFSSRKEVISEYTSQKVNPFIGVNKRFLHDKNIKKIDGRVAHLSLSGLENHYGHYLTECLGRYYLIEKSKFKPDFYILACHNSVQQQVIDLLGIEKARIIPANTNTLIQAKELIIPSFINNWEYIDFRGYKHFQKQYLPHWINHLYKDKIIPKIKVADPKKIYISRNDTKYRKLENEEELVALLIDRGFGIYELGKLSVKENIELFANASIVAGVHGAGFVDMMFAPPGTIIFEIFPEYYHDAGLRTQAVALGLSYHYMIGKTRNIDNVHPQQENVFVNLELLKKALDVILISD